MRENNAKHTNLLRICDQYESMNNGPHEGTLMTVTAPCILAQLSFWMPNGESWTDNNRMMQSVFFSIRESLEAKLREKLSAHSITVHPSDTTHEANKRIRSWRHTVIIEPYRIELIVYSHSEYWRVLIKVELSTPPPTDHVPPAFLAALSSTGTRDQINDYGAFALDVIDNLGNLDESLQPYFKRMFAAFYGIVTDVEQYDESSQFVVVEQSSQDKNWERVRRFKDARSFITKYWSNIRDLHKLGPVDVELTASTFNDGRAIYVSTLGHPQSPKLGDHVPVVYSIFSCIDDRWQLGRLLDTINSMGAVRLAALRDIEKISDLAEDMRRLRVGLRNGKGVRELRDDIEQVLRRDVSFRIERSARYWNQLQNRIHRLRIGSIEGFQPYGRFVDRRIGDTVAFIAGAGRQVAQLRKEIDLRYQAGQSEAIVRLQKTAEVLSIFPIAYYGSGLIPKSIKDRLHTQLFSYGEVNIIGVTFNSTIIEAVASVAMPVILAWLIVRTVHWRLK